MRQLGAATVAAGETKRVAGVQAHYDPSAWIGTMEVGRHGAALGLTIDRAEAGPHMPYGGQQELSAGTTFQSFIGPYRIEGSASSEEPPRSVTITVARRPCPDHTVIEPPTGPTWMWVSTEAIVQHTVDLQGQLLQVVLQSTGAAPQIVVSALGWRQAMTPEPGRARSFRADGRVVTIEQVVPGAATRFDGAWRADGPARLSALVRIEPAPPVPVEAAVAPTTACGAPAPHRTAVPVALAAAPARRGPAMRVAAGDHRRIEGLDLDVFAQELAPLPGPGHEQPERLLGLRSASLLAPSTLTFGAIGGSPQLARADRVLLSVEAAGAGVPPPQLAVRAFPLACPRAAAPLPSLAQPTTVWLSTVGQALFVLGAPDRPALTVQVHADPNHPSFSAQSESASDSGNLGATLVGHVAGLDSYRIEILDVVADAGTHATTWGWTADSGIPAVHVQFRIARE